LTDARSCADIESLYIHNVLENPNALFDESFEVVPQIFANLKELSIVSHRGGMNLFYRVLQRKYFPTLSRLTLSDITYSNPRDYYPITRPDDPLGFFAVVTSDGRMAGEWRPALDYENLRICLELGDMFEASCSLDLLVCPNFDFLEDEHRPLIKHLAIPTSSFPLTSSTKYALVPLSNRTDVSTQLDSVFDSLEELFRDDNVAKKALEYLSLPFTYESLPTERRAILDRIAQEGVKVCYDEEFELGGSIAPESFFEYLETKEKKDKEDAGAVKVAESE
jgi:hypothetical protein